MATVLFSLGKRCLYRKQQREIRLERQAKNRPLGKVFKAKNVCLLENWDSWNCTHAQHNIAYFSREINVY